jgi:hypothetical protein
MEKPNQGQSTAATAGHIGGRRGLRCFAEIRMVFSASSIDGQGNYGYYPALTN